MKQFHDASSSMDFHLLYLKNQACKHPCGDLKRQLHLTKLIRLIEQSGRLWKESTPYYEDALQLTWMYCCQNLCEAKTGNAYDSSQASIVTWLNAYLRWRLHDLSLEYQAQYNQIELDKVSESVAFGDDSARPSSMSSILEKTRDWVRLDESGELKQLHLKNHPNVTAQLLILHRLPPESSWKSLSNEFQLPISTLSSFYQRHCLPKLRNFGESQGYL